MKREVPVAEAIGMVLAHDVTQIIPGEFKGRLFKKGHVIQREDIEPLLSIGKANLYVLEPELDEIHEDEAAQLMAEALLHESLTMAEAHEGKVALKAKFAGVLRVREQRVAALNAGGELLLATKGSYVPVNSGETIGVARVIPLLAKEQKLREFTDLAKADAPVLEVLPYRNVRVGVVTTGSEVYGGLIEDKFGPLLQTKLSVYPVSWVGQTIVGDEMAAIASAILDWVDRGVNLVLVTGGMSVDPDDRTPSAIRSVAHKVVTYGVPMLPGSMLMLAYLADVTILGLPGGVLYDELTSFDVILPRLLAGVRMTPQDVAALGYGGLLK